MDATRTAMAFGLVLVVGNAALAQGTRRVSVDSNGVQGNDASIESSASTDGRFVAFASDASNLVAGDTNGFTDVFVHDRATRMTERVSVDSFSAEGNGASSSPSISEDGRFVAFESDASNLVSGDTNNFKDVFVHDRSSGSTERVSVDSSGAEGNWFSYSAGLSMDGQLVAFGSLSSNLVAGDTNGVDDVFVHDRSTGITERVSVDSLGAEGNRASFMSSISADGQVVAFNSDATNLVAGDTNRSYDVFVHDRSTGITERISVDSSGHQANDNSYWGEFSADDQVVSFASAASNLVSGDTNSAYDVFVHDRQTGVTERVSVDSSGQQAIGTSEAPTISADGQLVAFESDASNLVPHDTNQDLDVFVHDRSTGVTERVSVASSGGQGNNHSASAAISADGRIVAFTSWATNLVGGDTNGLSDVFVHGPYLTLEADPEVAPAGATLTFTSWTGLASAANLLVVTDINGTPTFVPIVVGNFDATGLWTLSGTVPSGLAGNTITFEILGIVPTGKVDVSNAATVSFQ